MAGITVLLMGSDVSLALRWKSLTINESIGQPDTLSIVLSDDIVAAVRTLLGAEDNYLYTHVYRNDELLFSGLALDIGRRNDHGVVSYSLASVGWEFLMPRRKVGTPYTWSIPPEAEWDGPLPEPAWVDPRAIGSPTPGAVQALFELFWNYPSPIDTTTYLSAILPEGAVAEQLRWSGSDLAGVMDDLCAAGSGAAMWYLANDSPLDLWAAGHPAPKLAVHFGLNSLPDEGAEEDVLGLPVGDEPTNAAPFAISDDPDWVTSIMASAVPELELSNRGRASGAYVRGATGNTLDVLPAPASFPVPFQIGLEHEGGTGWVGNGGGIWGEEYVDAPAAITRAQRDAFGSAYLAANGQPKVSGTIPVDVYGPWHKGQAVNVTDAGLGLNGRWLLIRQVTIKILAPGSAADADDEDPVLAAPALSYVLTVGDTLTAQLGYALRRQRLVETRQVVAPANKFVPWMSDLQPEPGGTIKAIMQLATDSGTTKKVKGVGAAWAILINGEWVEDPFDTANLFWLTDATTETDELGQIRANVNASADATAADAARVKAIVVLP